MATVAVDLGIARTINLAHPAFADWAKDFIRAEFVAYGKRHLGN